MHFATNPNAVARASEAFQELALPVYKASLSVSHSFLIPQGLWTVGSPWTAPSPLPCSPHLNWPPFHLSSVVICSERNSVTLGERRAASARFSCSPSHTLFCFLKETGPSHPYRTLAVLFISSCLTHGNDGLHLRNSDWDEHCSGDRLTSLTFTIVRYR